MRYLVISEDFKEQLDFEQYLECEVLNFVDEVDYNNFDFYVLLYKVNKGRCDANVIDTVLSLQGKHIALIGVGNSGYDINRALYKIAKANNNLVVYSKYTKTINSELISKDIINKVICTDGMEFSERFIGRLCRMIYKKEL